MKVKNSILLVLSVIIASIGCKNNDKVKSVKLDSTPYLLKYGGLPAPKIAQDNPLTVQGVKLGRMLFYEKMMSGNNEMACASCHLQEFAFTDTAQFSIGIQEKKGNRQAMTIFNMAWHSNEFFWDGRAHLLRDQSLLPIQDKLEMDEKLENVIAKLSGNQNYKDQFVRAFGNSDISSENISLALEQFMNSIVSFSSKYDAFLKDSTVFNESEKRGLKLFELEYNEFFPNNSGADCKHCHGGLNFENDQYMNNGLDVDGQFKDDGREKATKLVSDKAKFKVPSLRNIELTAPYMHDGRFATLEEVVSHYNHGINPSTTLDGALEQNRKTGLRLSPASMNDLVAFLKTLTDKDLTTNPAYSTPF